MSVGVTIYLLKAENGNIHASKVCPTPGATEMTLAAHPDRVVLCGGASEEMLGIEMEDGEIRQIEVKVL